MESNSCCPAVMSLTFWPSCSM